MFLNFYGLREQPFGVTPDPRFLFQSRTHREALASLQYGIQSSRGFIALLAEPGLGKTTLLFEVLQRLGNSARTAFLFQTQSDSRALMGHLLADLELDDNDRDPVRMHEQVKALLVKESRAGRRVIVVIDEAQNLEFEVLETIRLLSNFETPSAKLLQIILSGQPRLSEKLSNPALAQVRQRIGMTARLQPLAEVEVPAYIQHRLRVAGYQGGELFSPEAVSEIARVTGGVPRSINNVCFNALSLAFALDRKQVEGSMIAEVASDFDLALALSRRDLLGKFVNFTPPAEEIAPSQDVPSVTEASATETVTSGVASEIPIPAQSEPSGTDISEIPAIDAPAAEPMVGTVSSASAIPVHLPVLAARSQKKSSGVLVGTAAAIAASSWTVLRSTNSVAAAAMIAFACIAVGTRMLVTRTPRETGRLIRPASALKASAETTADAVTQPAEEATQKDQALAAANLESVAAHVEAPVAANNAQIAESNHNHRSRRDTQDESAEPESAAVDGASSPPLPGTEIAVVERDHPSSDVTVSHFFSLDPSFYPESAREQHLQGTVVLRGTINEAGVFSNVRALSGDHRLVLAAIRAVENRKFDTGPSGRGRRVSADLTLEFKLPALAAQTAQAGGNE